MIKACFFDIDGTLYSHKTDSVPESAVKALKELHEKGIKVVISTGRYLEELKKLPVMKAGIPFDGYLTLNGQMCLDQDFNMFAGNPIPENDTKVLLEMFAAEHVPLTLINENGRSINIVNEIVKETHEADKSTLPTVSEFKGEKIYQVNSYVDKHMLDLLKNFLDECDITSWSDTGIDIIAKGAGKDLGIQRFIDREGILKTETMAFGDAQNDIRMLKFAGIGVAMGNAKDEVKEIADYVTTDIDDNGIYNALVHFGLVGEDNKSWTESRDGENVTLTLSGRLDSVNAPAFMNSLPELLEGAKNLVFDFTDLKYISSTGLRAILSAKKTISAVGGEVSVVGVSDAVREILDMTGFSEMINIK